VLIGNHHVRSVGAVVRQRSRSGSESLSGDPGQSQDFDDSRPDTRIVIDDVDHGQVRRYVRGWFTHFLSWEAWAARMSITSTSIAFLARH
jgi:hypothetical protein